MKPRVLIAHGYPNPPGGGNAVFAWMLQALQDEFDVTLLTWHPADVAALNDHYGTSIRPDGFKLRLFPLPLVALGGSRDSMLSVKHAAMTPILRRIGAEYDVLLCPGEETDFGRPGIQYVHFPRCHDWRINPRIPRPADLAGLPWYHRTHFPIRTYVRLCRWWFGVTLDGMRRNLTLVNSEWTAERVREALDMSSVVVYPPVPDDFPAVPWEKREDGFVCIGRMCPGKRIDFMIEVVRGLRERGRAVHLHVIASRDNPEYLAQIEALQARNSDWLFLHLDVPHAEMTQCVAAHRYAIHAMENEHFGIAVAEAIHGGAIVFVPNSGGQVDIVGRRPELIYADQTEAMARISRVMDDERLRETLRAHLAAQGRRFTAAAFMDRIRAIVRDAVKEGVRLPHA